MLTNSKKTKFKFIQLEDPEYSKELMLRWEILRKPLGMPPGSELAEEEKQSLHLVALQEKKVVGCVLFYPETEERGRLFQMAVSEEYQGKGFGRQLIATLESALLKRGIKELYLHAREESVGFYLQLGYYPEGNFMEMMGLPHQLMKKRLHDCS